MANFTGKAQKMHSSSILEAILQWFLKPLPESEKRLLGWRALGSLVWRAACAERAALGAVSKRWLGGLAGWAALADCLGLLAGCVWLA